MEDRPLSPEKSVDVDEVHATHDRADQSWTSNGGMVSVPREVVAENQTQVLESGMYADGCNDAIVGPAFPFTHPNVLYIR